MSRRNGSLIHADYSRNVGAPDNGFLQLAETRHTNGSYNYFYLNYIFERKTNLLFNIFLTVRRGRIRNYLAKATWTSYTILLFSPPPPTLFSSLLHCPYRGLLSRSPSIPLVSTVSSDFLRAIGAIRDRPGTNSISG